VKTILTALIFLILPYIAFPWQAEVINVKDGDTLELLSGGSSVTLRLWGIDCPESSQEYGNGAYLFAVDFVREGMLEIETIDTDQYGRTVGLAYAGDLCLNEELIRAGWAWVYKQYCNKPICKEWEKLQENAKSAGIGLWESANPVPPWDYRKSNTKKKAEPNDPLALGIIFGSASILLIIIRLILRAGWAKKKRKWNTRWRQ